MRLKSHNTLKLSIIITGITTVITQIILLREFLSVFFGNELVMGIILANWMLLTGAGAYLGKFLKNIKNKISIIITLQVVLALMPMITVFLLNALKNTVFPVGSMLSLIDIIYSSLILLIPFCISSGITFTIFSTEISKNSNRINNVYYLESVGSLFGGIIFNFLLLFFFSTFQILTLILTINFLAAILLAITTKMKLPGIIIPIIFLFFLTIILKFDFESTSLRYLYKGQNIIYSKENQYGKLLVTKTDEQLNFYENGVSLFSTNNIIETEESVHYAMLQHSNPKNILLISGGISGKIQEILKYNIDKVDYLELNPGIIDVGYIFGTIPETRKLNIINKDARFFIKKTQNKYDIVLVNLPEPTTSRINRFYTFEFFSELKKKLNKDAVISISLGSSQNYLSKEEINTNSIMFNTLKTCFENIIIISGDRNYYLASDAKLNHQITHLVKNKNIENEYVNDNYLDDELLLQRSNFIQNSLSPESRINKDFKPLSYYSQLLLWMSYFKDNVLIISIVVFIILVFILLKINIISLGLFAGGFAASSSEIIILISFQIIYGYVYNIIGIIITLFMAGLAIGSFFLPKLFKDLNKNLFIRLQFCIGIFSIILPFIIIACNILNFETVILHSIFYILTLLISIMTGFQFAIATKIRKSKIPSLAAESYSSDLLGSAVGALLTSALLIPLMGIINVGIFIGLLNIICGLIILLRRNRIITLR
ncbi:MAG: hypothetical protein K8R41_12185 [Bacteroidales bacterium]|nr:hypothetical protein [Bacteroidales bacterium]